MFPYWLLVPGVIGNSGCGSEPMATDLGGMAMPQPGAQPPAAPGPCVLPADCNDIPTLFFSSKARCTLVTAYGYELGPLSGLCKHRVEVESGRTF